MAALGISAVATASLAGSVSAGSLLDRIKNGGPIRIGFSTDTAWSFKGDNNEMLGIGNVLVMELLKKLGASKFEPVDMEWGSLIPAMQGGRFDVITSAMFVLPPRCRNVLFTDPFATVYGGLVVPKGNPKRVHSLPDIRDKGLTFVTGAGYADVKRAQQTGIPDEKIMQVAGYVEIAQAVRSGRADAGGGEYLGIKGAIRNDDSLELANPFKPNYKPGYPAFAFPKGEEDTVAAMNALLKDYMGSAEMISLVSKYGYDKSLLPDGSKTDDLCKS
ncbi:ectoine/hydroxyectoine ABC transporter substrate-binding protein EhuB [Mesorhizobium sp. WSM3882]|nr:ectoine/hydroxyectoine ABC transporter substrate-binding protein EhuB [Mesorhizobium sp. WSM3882]